VARGRGQESLSSAEMKRPAVAWLAQGMTPQLLPAELDFLSSIVLSSRH